MHDTFTFHHTGRRTRQRLPAVVAMLAFLLAGPFLASRAIEGRGLVAQMLRLPIEIAVVAVVVLVVVLVRRSRLRLRIDLSPTSLALDGERVVVPWTDLEAVWFQTSGPHTFLAAQPRAGTDVPRYSATFPVADEVSPGHLLLAPIGDLDVHVATAVRAVQTCAGDLLVDDPPPPHPVVRTTFERRLPHRVVPAVAAAVVGWYALTFVVSAAVQLDAPARTLGATLLVGVVVAALFTVLTVRSCLPQRLVLTPDELRITAYGHTNGLTWGDLAEVSTHSSRGLVVEVVARPREGSPRPRGLRGFGFPRWNRGRSELSLFPTGGWDGSTAEILTSLPVFAGPRWVGAEPPLESSG